MTKSYRKKPIVIQAVQWKGDNIEEIKKFARDNIKYDKYGKVLIVDTLEGTMKAPVESWIIKGAHGEFYPIDNNVFKDTYEEVKE